MTKGNYIHHHGSDCPISSDAGAVPADFRFEDYARSLWQANKMMKSLDFSFAVVSGSSGLLDCLSEFMDAVALLAISDESDASGDISASPSLVRSKTMFFCMRHAENDPEARSGCLRTIRTLQQQFLSRMLRDRMVLAGMGVSLVPEVDIHESDKYFFNGCTMSYMTVGYTIKSSLRYDAEQWDNI